MRKFITNIIKSIIIVTSSALFSCTQNEGDIGDLFGLWSLNDFYSNDVNISGERCDGYSLKFQSNIVQYVKKLPYHDSLMFTGFWQLRSDSLFLSFPDIANISESYIYNNQGKENHNEVVFPIYPSLGFKINTLSNSVLDISRTTSDGEELRYYFKKLN